MSLLFLVPVSARATRSSTYVAAATYNVYRKTVGGYPSIMVHNTKESRKGVWGRIRLSSGWNSLLVVGLLVGSSCMVEAAPFDVKEISEQQSLNAVSVVEGAALEKRQLPRPPPLFPDLIPGRPGASSSSNGPAPTGGAATTNSLPTPASETRSTPAPTNNGPSNTSRGASSTPAASIPTDSSGIPTGPTPTNADVQSTIIQNTPDPTGISSSTSASAAPNSTLIASAEQATSGQASSPPVVPIVVGSVIGGTFLIAFVGIYIIRKGALRPSSNFRMRMNPNYSSGPASLPENLKNDDKFPWNELQDKNGTMNSTSSSNRGNMNGMGTVNSQTGAAMLAPPPPQVVPMQQYQQPPPPHMMAAPPQQYMAPVQPVQYVDYSGMYPPPPPQQQYVYQGY
ncbi:hypothetical protein HK102_009052 [Quaeritorhiza haematococci]|nr:hypothetical protein HK102_009052 [Quaeritorhiza haematococci]